jgi:hypothetical protein
MGNAVVVCDWFGDSPIAREIGGKAITSLSLSPDHTQVLITDCGGHVYVADVERMNTNKCSGKVFPLAKFIAAAAVSGVSGTEISVRNPSNSAIVRPGSRADHLLLKSVQKAKG